MLSANILNEKSDQLFTPHQLTYRHELPILKVTERAAFEGDVEYRLIPPGVILFQAQRTGQIDPGRWFGFSRPVNSSHADILFNMKKWGNDGGQIKRYLVLSYLKGYWGRVAGGLGSQFFIPEGHQLEAHIHLL